MKKRKCLQIKFYHIIIYLHSAWVRAENVKDYLEYKEKYTQNIKLRALRDAVDHIEDYIKRKEVSIESFTCLGEERYLFSCR